MDAELVEEMERLNLQIVAPGHVNTLCVQPTVEDRIWKAQANAPELQEIKKLMGMNKAPKFWVDKLETVCYEDQICVPKKDELRKIILDEAHNSAYSIHPGSTKMYQDLRQKYWWVGMKRDIAELVARCDICKRVKVECKRPAGLLQSLHIPVWKWDDITMDFIVGLPHT